MGAADLLQHVRGAGFALEVSDGKLLVTPASMLTNDLRDALRASKPELIELLTGQAMSAQREFVVGQGCGDCQHFGRHRTCLEPVAAGQLTAAQGFGIVWPPEGHGATCPAFTGKIPTPAADQPRGLANDEVERCHAPSWGDAEITAFKARTERFALSPRRPALTPNPLNGVNLNLAQHPLSAAFPAMPDDDFAALCADIKANGLIQPIVLFESQVIDGWHRYRACVEVGIEPRSSMLPEGADPVAFVLACNLHRRHLTASQRALAIVTCSNWRSAGRPTVNSAPGAELTAKQMAVMADVGTRTIEQAKEVVAKAAPDVVESVKAGKVSVKTAAAKTSKPKAKPAAKPKKEKPALAAVAPDPDLESPAEIMADMQKDIDRLNGLLAAADAEDQKAEALKWRRAYDTAVRGQSDAMDRAHKSVEREKWIKKQLLRCGKTVGEDDEFKIAAAVEAMFRAYKLAAKNAESAALEPDDDDGPSAEEIAAAQREAADDQKRLQLLLESDEPLSAANARIKEQDARIRLLEERVRGLTNECAMAIRQAKSWCTKFEKLERTGVAA